LCLLCLLCLLPLASPLAPRVSLPFHLALMHLIHAYNYTTEDKGQERKRWSVLGTTLLSFALICLVRTYTHSAPATLQASTIL
jgi:hypothetical protein